MNYNWRKSKENIKKILNNKITYIDNQNTKIKDIHYKMVYKGWIAVISVDLRNYQDLCKKTNPEVVTKIIQVYSSEIITIGKNDNYVFSSLNGDEVILVYKTETKKSCKEVLDIAIRINIFKEMLKKIIYEKWWIEIDFGIGIALQNNQIIAKYGKKYNSDENEPTVMGTVINEASKLSKKHCEIQVSDLFKGKIDDKKYFLEGFCFQWFFLFNKKYLIQIKQKKP